MKWNGSIEFTRGIRGPRTQPLLRWISELLEAVDIFLNVLTPSKAGSGLMSTENYQSSQNLFTLSLLRPRLIVRNTPMGKSWLFLLMARFYFQTILNSLIHGRLVSQSKASIFLKSPTEISKKLLRRKLSHFKSERRKLIFYQRKFSGSEI